MELGLQGRVAFITGASRGIGAAIAEEFAAEGAHLGLFGRDRAACEALAGRLEAAHGVRAAYAPIDFERPETIGPAVAQVVAALGGVDILVNNAGGAPRGLLHEIPDGDWLSGFLVKPIGLMRMSREVIPHLRRSAAGCIVNIGGTRGREPSTFSTMAGPINMGTLGATKVLANYLGPDGIRVNAVAPGTTDTGRFTELIGLTARERGLSREEAERHLLREVPLGKVVMPVDVAKAVVFLASDAARMITGTAINVDGGRTRSI